ncbi:hypothetical protein [Haloechinothrix salitolerans]|uniref:Uncharacterized protein n=1 Tax=Haloechinothrix salitolerans TaxID=926830 RepID=A0ABW2C8X6_9PSEU
MTDRELEPLHDAAAGNLLFHTGRWGGPAGYRWRGPDGDEAGLVPSWQELELDRLRGLGLVVIEPGRGPFDRKVTVTERGIAALRMADAA